VEQKWVSVLVVNNPAQAEILRGLLDAQGVPARLLQEPAARALGLHMGPLGEISVLVPEDRQAEAEAILAAFFSGEFEDADD